MATVPDTWEVQKVEGLQAPIKGVTVYPRKAEITRVFTFSPDAKGLHEVELTGLPGWFHVEEQSLAVKGSGLCTILDFSFAKPSNENAAEKEKVKAEKRKEVQVARDAKMEALWEEHARLARQYSRIQRLSQLVDSVVDKAVAGCAPSTAHPILGPGAAIGDSAAFAAAAATAAATAAAQDSTDISGVSTALDWWEKKAADLDEEYYRVAAEGKRVLHAMEKLEREYAAELFTLTKQDPSGFLFGDGIQQPQDTVEGRMLVTVDVDTPLSPIELEVSYMTPGATWSPSYDLRVDTETDSVTCTYYGRVSQNTSEDWKGVTLKLSTVEPSARSTPPALAERTVSFKEPPIKQILSKGRARASGFSFGGHSVPSSAAFGFGSATSTQEPPAAAPGSFGSFAAGGGFGCAPSPPSAPPPPSEAKPAVAQVEGGSGSMGPVTFVVKKPASIKNNGETKKLSVAVLQLSTEVVHYIVPSKEPAAYLQLKATNATDYLLLASDAVSVFFDNSFVARTSLNSVSPGESFQTFLGVDPAVKVEVAPTRKTNKKKGLFGNADRVTHCCSTSISNKKKVPVTCVMVEALPLSNDERIKVTLEEPAPTKATDAAEAINDETLVDAALDTFGGGERGGRGETDKDGNHGDPASKAAKNVVTTEVAGVAKGLMNHLAWVVKIAPQDDILVPLEYTVEWPMDKEIVFGE